MRKNTKIIIWTVVVSFILWGGYSVSAQLGKQNRLAGEIFGKGISFQEYNKFYRISQLFNFGGKPVNDPDALQSRTWQNLIYDYEAKKRKIRVSDDEVREQIVKLLAQQGITNTDPAFYQRWLQATLREEPRSFEEKIREVARIQKMVQSFLDGPVEMPDDNWLKKEYELGAKLIACEVVKIPTSEEAKNFYEKNKTAKEWSKTIAENPKLATKLPLTPISRIMGQWPLSEKDARELFDLSKDSVSRPFDADKEYLIFRVLDKQTIKRDPFDDWKKKYQENIGLQKFLLWSAELQKKANLKDYVPSSSGKNDLPQ